MPPLYKDWVFRLQPKTGQIQLAVGQQAGSKEGMGGELGGRETLQSNHSYFLLNLKHNSIFLYYFQVGVFCVEHEGGGEQGNKWGGENLVVEKPCIQTTFIF